jgi:hypothetical protein
MGRIAREASVPLDFINKHDSMRILLSKVAVHVAGIQETGSSLAVAFQPRLHDKYGDSNGRS